jgi:hypothetical protein
LIPGNDPGGPAGRPGGSSTLRAFLYLAVAVAFWTALHYLVHMALPDLSLLARRIDVATLPLACLASWWLIRRLVVVPKRSAP